MKINRGTIVDASIINAPTSTKNKDKQRDPNMHQTRKGNQWNFGMKTQKQHSPEAKDFTNKKVSRYKTMTNRDHQFNRQKSKMRSRVEHVNGVLKRQFGYNKVRYRGLDKNTQAVFNKCALISLYLVKKQLLTN